MDDTVRALPFFLSSEGEVVDNVDEGVTEMDGSDNVVEVLVTKNVGE